MKTAVISAGFAVACVPPVAMPVNRAKQGLPFGRFAPQETARVEATEGVVQLGARQLAEQVNLTLPLNFLELN